MPAPSTITPRRSPKPGNYKDRRNARCTIRHLISTAQVEEKSSVARVRVYQGTGKVTINDRDIDDYFGLETLKLIVRQPLVATETDQKFDIVCRVAGGGVTGQAGAIRHGIARALLQYDSENLRPDSEEGRFPDPRPENEGT